MTLKAATCSLLAAVFGWKNRGIPGSGTASGSSAVVAVVTGGVTFADGDACGEAGSCAFDGDDGVGCMRTNLLEITLIYSVTYLTRQVCSLCIDQEAVFGMKLMQAGGYSIMLQDSRTKRTEKAVDGGLLSLGDRGVAREDVGVVVGPLSGLPALQSSTSCHTYISPSTCNRSV